MANIFVRFGEGRGCGYRKFLLCCKILQGRGHCELLGWKRFSSLKYGNLGSKWSRF